MRYSVYTQPDYSVGPVTLVEAKAHLRVDGTSEDVDLWGKLRSCFGFIERYIGRFLSPATVDVHFEEWPDGDYFELPFPPLSSVTSLTYKATDGTASTWAASNYIVDTASEPGRVVRAYGISYPSDSLYPSNPITIRIACGYTQYRGTINVAGTAVTKTAGTDFSTSDLPGRIMTLASDSIHQVTAVASTTSCTITPTGGVQAGVSYNASALPDDIRQAVFVLLGHMYRNREAVVIGNTASAIGSPLPIAFYDLLEPYRTSKFSGIWEQE